jgi:hypothetical protein
MQYTHQPLHRLLHKQTLHTQPHSIVMLRQRIVDYLHMDAPHLSTNCFSQFGRSPSFVSSRGGIPRGGIPSWWNSNNPSAQSNEHKDTDDFCEREKFRYSENEYIANLLLSKYWSGWSAQLGATISERRCYTRLWTPHSNSKLQVRFELPPYLDFWTGINPSFFMFRWYPCQGFVLSILTWGD